MRRYSRVQSNLSPKISGSKSLSVFSADNTFFCLRILIFSVILLFAVYVVAVHQAIVFGYQIDQAKKTVISYEINNQNLKADLSNIKSIKNIEEIAGTRGLQVENKPIYIKIDSVKMASRGLAN